MAPKIRHLKANIFSSMKKQGEFRKPRLFWDVNNPWDFLLSPLIILELEENVNKTATMQSVPSFVLNTFHVFCPIGITASSLKLMRVLDFSFHKGRNRVSKKREPVCPKSHMRCCHPLVWDLCTTTPWIRPWLLNTRVRHMKKMTIFLIQEEKVWF